MTKAVKLDWRLLTWAAIALYVAMSGIYLLFGTINDDEGWYLYASQLVFQGHIPYRDFAYTQMPLLPYVYGLPQLFAPSLILGRVTSVVLGLANLFFSLSLARRHAGQRGAALTALLLGTFTYGIYFSTIVKTYSLVAFSFTLTCWVLSSDLPEPKYLLAVLASFVAAMTRLSAVAFWIPVVAYGVLAARKQRISVAVVLLACTLGLGSLILFLLQLDRTVWNLFTYHSLPWNDYSLAAKLAHIAAIRIPDWIQFYDLYILILVSAALFALGDRKARTTIRAYLSDNLPLLVTGIGLGLFAVSHLAAGSWHLEHLVPAVISFMPILAIAALKLYDLAANTGTRRLLVAGLLIVLVVMPARHNIQHIAFPGRDLSAREVGQVSALISELTLPTDRVLSLQALWAVIGSNRSVLPGLSMAQFSYHELDREQAQRLRVVNGEIVQEYIQTCAAHVVLLTDLDWQLLAGTGEDREIFQSLQDRYELILTKTTSHWPGTLDVYVCRTDPIKVTRHKRMTDGHT